MKQEQAREKKRAKLEQMLLRKQRRKQTHYNIRKDDDLPGKNILSIVQWGVALVGYQIILNWRGISFQV